MLKSGTQAEPYRLVGGEMKTLLGFLSVIAMDLLQLTYLHRTQPDAPAKSVLSEIQLQVLQAKVPCSSPLLTVEWAVKAIA